MEEWQGYQSKPLERFLEYVLADIKALVEPKNKKIMVIVLLKAQTL